MNWNTDETDEPVMIDAKKLEELRASLVTAETERDQARVERDDALMKEMNLHRTVSYDYTRIEQALGSDFPQALSLLERAVSLRLRVEKAEAIRKPFEPQNDEERLIWARHTARIDSEHNTHQVQKRVDAAIAERDEARSQAASLLLKIEEIKTLGVEYIKILHRTISRQDAELEDLRAKTETTATKPASDADTAPVKTYRIPSCRGCGELINSKNYRVADGCPCNTPRGVNYGLVAKATCTCAECDPMQTGSTRYPDAP